MGEQDVAAGARGAGRELKPLEVIRVEPPPVAERVRRQALRPGPGERSNRYTLPAELSSGSPVGYRTRIPLTHDEARVAAELLSLRRPTTFVPPAPVTEEELFEESALGVLSSRQSTNYQGHRQVTLGPADSAELASLLRQLAGLDAAVLDGAAYSHVFLTRPYRTPFTLLLTFVGHAPIASLATVPVRALQKRWWHRDDIPSVGYLQLLHLGILADASERATVIASEGRRRAQLHLSPFCGRHRAANKDVLRRIEELCGLGARDRARGWRVGLVVQAGEVPAPDRIEAPRATWRKLGASLLAFRSERIQPGVNQDEHAPAEYRRRQSMDVPEELSVQAGRAAYNAFSHLADCDRERSKELLLLDRIDVLTPGGKGRLRALRNELSAVSDRIQRNLPWWADLPTGRALSRGVNMARKAFGLAGQRIYVVGLSRREIDEAGIDWELAICATGGAAARSALYVELMGCVDLPSDCDLLAGTCLMAGPINQNDIAKQFYGGKDLLAETFAGRDPTSLLVWTVKAKTVADPIGNEEQLLNPARKGKLVELRPAPHEAVALRIGDELVPMRRDGERAAVRTNGERAFSDVGNFVLAPDGSEIAGNRGEPWPEGLRRAVLWR